MVVYIVMLVLFLCMFLILGALVLSEDMAKYRIDKYERQARQFEQEIEKESRGG